MLKNALNFYKVPLIASLTVFIVLLGLSVTRDPITIALLFLGSLAGTFFLDLDYILYAYFLDPQEEFSIQLQSFLKHKDFNGAFSYIHFHRRNLKELTLHSALFQIVLAGLMVFVMYSNASLFFKALMISTFVNSLYRMAQTYFEGDIYNWFWAVKLQPTRNVLLVFSGVMVCVLVVSLLLL